MDVGCYYLPGNRSAPPPGDQVHGGTGHTEVAQSLFDPLPYGWSLGGGAMKMTKFSVNLTCVAASKCKHSLVTTGVSVSLIAINTVSLHLLRMAGPPC